MAAVSQKYFAKKLPALLVKVADKRNESLSDADSLIFICLSDTVLLPGIEPGRAVSRLR